MDYKSFKVAEIKSELTKRGLSTKGLKKELLERLEAADAGGTDGGDGGDAIGGAEKSEGGEMEQGDKEKPVEGETEVETKEPEKEMENGQAEAADALQPASEPESAPPAQEAEPTPTATTDVPAPIEPAKNDAVATDATEKVAEDVLEKPTEVELSIEAETEAGVKDVKVADVKVDDNTQDIEIEMEIEVEEPEQPKSAVEKPVEAPKVKEITQAEAKADEVKMAKSEKVEEPKAVEMTPAEAAGAPTAEAAPEPEPVDATAGDKRKREDDMDVDEGLVPAADTKRRRASVSRPPGLSHTIHPPTSALYITNLRRPLLQPQLIEFLTSFAPLSTGVSPSLPDGVWIDGVKSHCYAIFQSTENAITAAQGIHGVKWPEDMGVELHVEFVETEQVERLVTQEKVAWITRGKLALSIEEQDGEFKFVLNTAGPPSRGGAGAGFRQMPLATGIPPRGFGPGHGHGQGPVATGVNAIRPSVPIRAPPPHMSGPVIPAANVVVKRTRARPSLTYSEGPGAGTGSVAPLSRARAPLPPQVGPPQNGWGRRGGGGGFGGGRDGGLEGGGRGGRGGFQGRDRW